MPLIVSPEWAMVALTVLGFLFHLGSYVAVKVAIGKFEVENIEIKRRITVLEKLLERRADSDRRSTHGSFTDSQP